MKFLLGVLVFSVIVLSGSLLLALFANAITETQDMANLIAVIGGMPLGVFAAIMSIEVASRFGRR